MKLLQEQPHPDMITKFAKQDRLIEYAARSQDPKIAMEIAKLTHPNKLFQDIWVVTKRGKIGEGYGFESRPLIDLVHQNKGIEALKKADTDMHHRHGREFFGLGDSGSPLLGIKPAPKPEQVGFPKSIEAL